MMALSIAGTVLSVVGTLQAAAATQQAANYNAEVARVNQTIATQQAAADAKSARVQQQRTMGAIAATAAANGVDMTGSVLDVASDSFLEHEMNIASIAYQGKVKTADYKNQERGYKMEADNAMKSGFVKAIGVGIEGAGQALKLA